MTSPGLVYRSPETNGIFDAFTAVTAAEAGILAAPGVTSRFTPHPREASRVTPRSTVPARTCPGIPRQAECAHKSLMQVGDLANRRAELEQRLPSPPGPRAGNDQQSDHVVTRPNQRPSRAQ